MIEVVAGIIIRKNRILLTQRSEASDFPYLFECPGGKVEPGEWAHDALNRELMEELGIDAAVFDAEATFEFHPPICKTPARVTFYSVDIGLQTPRPIVALGLCWFTADELLHLNMCPANDRFRKSLALMVKISE